jgi:anti-sigma-K factor RskA
MLGLASPEESTEVKRMAALYPEVQEIIDSYQKTLEEYGKLQAFSPSPALKSRIMQSLHEEIREKPGNAVPIFTGNNTLLALRRWKRVAVAASIILVLSLILNGVYIGKYRKSVNRYTALVQSRTQIAAQNEIVEARLAVVEKKMQVLMNPAMKSVVMEGVDKHPGMTATVYWNPQSRETYLGTSNLPDPPSGKSYQLWAIVDGKPVDMGMYNPAIEKGLLAMKNVVPGKVQAFAITLEKQGGSPVPTMDQMYVIGKI